MSEAESQILRLIKAELLSVGDSSRRESLRALLVHPEIKSLKWGYGAPGQRFDCWLVGRATDGQVRLYYCEQGFGPTDPWGFVFADQDWMGMDCQWHIGLEHAAINAGLLPAPPDYEVP